MIEDLIKTPKISPEEYKVYQLFQCTEIGRDVLKEMAHFTFMEQPTRPEMNGVTFAFLDGRRSILRDIHLIIEKVLNAMKENLND